MVVLTTMVIYGGNKIAGSLYAGSIFFEVAFGWSIWVSVPGRPNATSMKIEL